MTAKRERLLLVIHDVKMLEPFGKQVWTVKIFTDRIELSVPIEKCLDGVTTLEFDRRIIIDKKTIGWVRRNLPDVGDLQAEEAIFSHLKSEFPLDIILPSIAATTAEVATSYVDQSEILSYAHHLHGIIQSTESEKKP